MHYAPPCDDKSSGTTELPEGIMALSKFTVRCIKNYSPELIDELFDEIVADSYTDEEEAHVIWLSAYASINGF